MRSFRALPANQWDGRIYGRGLKLNWIGHQRRYCPECWPTRQREAAAKGSQAAQASLATDAQKSIRGRAVSQGRRAALDDLARTLGHDPVNWTRDLAPHVRNRTLAEISAATGLSTSHASKIRRGIQTPHPKHWSAFYRLVGQQ